MRLRLIISCGFLFVCANFAAASDLYVYPKNNQTADQQRIDESECYTWAKNQSGFDPQATYQASTPRPQSSSEPQGDVFRGAARGAVLGEIIGNDAGTGAAAGAAIGTMRRRDRIRQEQNDAKQWEQQEAARYNELRSNYTRAFKGCMEAREYSIS